MTTKYLLPLPAKDALPIGQKALAVNWLMNQKATVPTAVSVTYAAHDIYRDHGHLPDDLRAELAQIIQPDKAYAVRSSSNVEDGAAFSFAGQFTSVLDVRGVDEVLNAITAVYDSANTAGLRSYLAQHDMSAEALRMGILIQEMAPPVISGVSFSKNPLTGLDEQIVEAVEGSGEQLVQDGVTPQRWVFKWGDWVQQPDSDDGDKLDSALILQVVRQTQQIAAAYGAPIDLEWVYDGEQINWVQVRPISTLQNINIYSNRISREVLPGIIKPLVWSVNVPLVNRAWVDIFTELIGENDIQPEELSKAFYYRAYFNMGTIGRVFEALGMPSGTLELMMGLEGGDERPTFRPSGGVVRHLPRMMRFGWAKWRYSHEIERFLPQMRTRYAEFAREDLSSLDERGLLTAVDELFAFTVQAAYMNIVGPILAQVYDGMLRRRLAKLEIDTAVLDMARDKPELDDYDPNHFLAHANAVYRQLPTAVQEQIANATYAEFQQMTGLGNFQQLIQEFLQRFGHNSDSGNDFSRVPWREDPALVLNMVINFVAPTAETNKQSWAELPLSAGQRFRLRGTYRRARDFRYYREAISAAYTFGYGLFRPRFLALGQKLVARGLMHAADDIFYLYMDELRDLVAAGDTAVSVQALIDGRKADIELSRDALLPDLIYGDEPPPLDMADEAEHEHLRGTPTSRGYYRGETVVINSIKEFDKMKPGAILVIPYSDVSWTPLFTQAGAVIAEAGGMLSHSSIVAREYGLPAVVSVANACRLLQDGELVAVDGYKGDVVRLSETADSEQVAIS
jgi:phosphohistidine swiveling domain-containing protein